MDVNIRNTSAVKGVNSLSEAAVHQRKALKSSRQSQLPNFWQYFLGGTYMMDLNYVWIMPERHPGFDMVQIWRDAENPECLIVEMTETKYAHPTHKYRQRDVQLIDSRTLIRKKALVANMLDESTYLQRIHCI